MTPHSRLAPFCLLALLPAVASVVARAQPAAVPTEATVVQMPPVMEAPAAPPAMEAVPPGIETLLGTRGETELSTLLSDSGLANRPLTPETRARLKRALDERNNALRRANARLADELRRAFNVSDEQLAQSISATDDQRQMERIRRFQPKRYQALTRARAKQKK